MSWVLEGSAPGGGLAFTSGSLEISLVPETQVKFELTFCDGSQGRLILPSLSRGSSQGPPAFLAPRAPARPSPLSGCAPCLSVPMAPWARRGEGGREEPCRAQTANSPGSSLCGRAGVPGLRPHVRCPLA